MEKFSAAYSTFKDKDDQPANQHYLQVQFDLATDHIKMLTDSSADDRDAPDLENIAIHLGFMHEKMGFSGPTVVLVSNTRRGVAATEWKKELNRWLRHDLPNGEKLLIIDGTKDTDFGGHATNLNADGGVLICSAARCKDALMANPSDWDKVVVVVDKRFMKDREIRKVMDNLQEVKENQFDINFQDNRLVFLPKQESHAGDAGEGRTEVEDHPAGEDGSVQPQEDAGVINGGNTWGRKLCQFFFVLLFVFLVVACSLWGPELMAWAKALSEAIAQAGAHFVARFQGGDDSKEAITKWGDGGADL